MDFEIVEKDGSVLLRKATLADDEVDIVVPDGVTEIAKDAFKGCSFVRSVKLPDGLRIIRNHAFRACKALESVNIPDSVIQIGGLAFEDTPWLSAKNGEFVIVGDGILLVYNGNGNKAVIPDGVKRIAPKVFADRGLSEVQLPASLEVIGSYAFENCTGLENITFPEGLRQIHSSAFRNTGLKELWLPDSVEAVGHQAFYVCRFLENVCMSENIVTMESAPFGGCIELKQIRVRKSKRTEPFEWYYLWNGFSSNTVIYIESEFLPRGVLGRHFDHILYVPNYNFKDELSVEEWMCLIFSVIRARARGFVYPAKVVAGAVNVLKENDYFRRHIITKKKHLELVDFLREFRLLTIKECDDIIQEYSDKDPEFTQRMIEYRAGFTAEEIEEYNDSFFRDLTIAEAKKNWKFSYNEDGTITLNEYIGYDRNIEIPASISGAAVTVIGSGTFTKMDNLDNMSSDKVVFNIPYGIERIEKDAFPTEQTIRGRNISVGFNIFQMQKQDKELLYLPDSITEIDEGAFVGCTCVENVRLPSGFECIPMGLFSNSYIASVEYPDSLKVIGPFSFAKTRLTEADIPDGTVEIGNGAFGGCSWLKKLNIPDTVKRVGDAAFSHTSITSLTLPKSLEELGDQAFGNCFSLTGITLPEGLTHIPAGCFQGCSIKTIDIPESVRSISDAAFRGCRALEKLELPQDLVELGASAFSSCGSLGDVVIPPNVRCIGEHCFSGSGVTSVTFGRAVKVVGSFAFCKTQIESITLPKGIKYGDHSFAECSRLKEVVIEDGTEYLGEACFRSCVSLKNITIPGSVISIEKQLFSDCTGLEEVNILDGVTAIGSKAFSNCHNLKTVNIPESVVSISPDAFHNWRNLVICAPVGSYAIEYAKRIGINFRRLSRRKKERKEQQ